MGNPKTILVDCLENLFSLIRFLEQHIEIAATNNSRNIWYVFQDNEIQLISTGTQPKNKKNRYEALKHKTDLAVQDNNILESILNSDSDNSSYTTNKPDKDIYN